MKSEVARAIAGPMQKGDRVYKIWRELAMRTPWVPSSAGLRFLVQYFHCEAMKGLIFLRHSWLQIVAVFYQFRVPTAELCCYQSIDRFQRL